MLVELDDNQTMSQSDHAFSNAKHENSLIEIKRCVGNLCGDINSYGSSLTRITGGGDQFVYFYHSGLGAYVNPGMGAYYDLLLFKDNQWIWVEGGSSRVEIYYQNPAINDEWCLAIESSGENNSTVYSYNALNGLLQAAIDYNGSAIKVHYNDGNVDTVEAADCDNVTNGSDCKAHLTGVFM